MKLLKNYLLPIILVILLFFTITNIDWIKTQVADILEKNPKIVIGEKNEYAKDYDFLFVQRVNSYTPYNKHELINIFFSIINNGWDNFTFYCPTEYTDCINDLKTISDDDTLLTNINNFTHPYNNFNHIKTAYYENGEVNIEIEHLYTNEWIILINKRVDEIIEEVTENDMNDEEKIKAIHDYIINNTTYDTEKNLTGTSKYKSNTAYGLLFEHYAICSGYSDIMAIFLEKLNLKNYKIASNTHVWNAVYLDNTWYHLDLTWNDPVSEDGRDNLWHKYFLIKTDKFSELDKENEEDHKFDTSIYLEFKNN